MSYFLRQLIREESTAAASSPESGSSLDENTRYSNAFASILRESAQRTRNEQILFLPTASEGMRQRLPPIRGERSQWPAKLEDVTSVVAAPSCFALHSMMRTIVLKYSMYVQDERPRASERRTSRQNSSPLLPPSRHRQQKPTNCPPMVMSWVECMEQVLDQLSERDPELCVQALSALLSSLQLLSFQPGQQDPMLQRTHDSLLRLHFKGRADVSSKAASCLVALAVATFSPSFLFSTVASLLCDRPKNQSSSRSDGQNCPISVPENHQRLALFVQQRSFANGSEQYARPDWWTQPLTAHATLCCIDLSATPSDSSPETPDDDRRLQGAIASDGPYLYVLNYLGLFKIGSGLSESIAGKLYASNNMLKASRNCMLTFCNSSLYLRRGQSSRVWVLDTDSLRERGEIMLQPGPTHSTIFSDGSAFYQAYLDSHSTLIITRLNDFFLPCAESKMKQKLRLTRLAYSIFGDAQPTPHQLPQSLPNTLHGQISDLHMGKDVALLLARNGKVYYAGSGSKLGLQETGTSWMELVLPETIVQISVGAENVLFRSGSGHVWIAGSEEKKRIGKLRRLHTIGKKKVISTASSANCFAYVTENGRVYVCGKHSWRVHPESGMVLGLDGIHVATIALGKSHAVAVSRHGQMITWGVNNLGQCGRVEQPSAGSSPRHSSLGASKQPPATCSAAEHLWMRDVASICLACGKCSSRGAACARSLTTVPGSLCPCGPGETTCLRCGICRACGEKDLPTFLATGCETTESAGSSQQSPLATPQKIVLGPARVLLQKSALADIKVSAVSCGNFHTILLAADRQVFTFGSNCHGQLGVGDLQRHLGPQKVVLPSGVQAVQVTAGANHSLVRTADGSVYSFGAFKAGQLGREGEADGWHSKPEVIPGFGPSSSNLAAWVGAVGDVTFIHSHTTLLTEDAIADADIVANKQVIFIFPRQIGKEYIVVRRRQNAFSCHQLGPAGLYTTFSLETTYNMMWSYAAAEMRICGQTEHAAPGESAGSTSDELLFVRTPELWLPLESAGPAALSAHQLSATLLSTTYALTVIAARPPVTAKAYTATEGESCGDSPPDATSCNGRGRCVVSRFTGYGGGWGYSAHSVDALQFRVSVDILLLGMGLCGGHGEYNARLSLLRLGSGSEDDRAGDEMFVEEMASTDEVIYECPPRDVSSILFPLPVLIRANTWHVISAKISGPSSDCGSDGRPVVAAEGGVVFTFRNSALSNNGTDVSVGQFPEIYFQMTTAAVDDAVEEERRDDALHIALHSKLLEDIGHIRRSSLVHPDSSIFSSLLRILDFSCQLVFIQSLAKEEALWEKERAGLHAVLTLRILSFYVNVILPEDGAEPSENETETVLDEHVASIFGAFLRIFQRAPSKVEQEMDPAEEAVLEEAAMSFIRCAHIFFSSRWFLLSQLAQLITSSPSCGGWWLSAVLHSWAAHQDPLGVLFEPSEAGRFPSISSRLLAAYPPEPAKVKNSTGVPAILAFLFDIAFGRHHSYNLPGTLSLEKIADELIVKIAGDLVKGETASVVAPAILQSPSRFRRRSANASWDMATGASDAVCFRVEQPGLSLAGMGVYMPASQHPVNFTIEVMCSESETAGEAAPKWKSLHRVSQQLQSAGLVSGNQSADSASIHLPRPLPLDHSLLYALRVTSNDAGKTFCGESGASTIRLSKGVRVVFSSCNLSENGTSVARGQIPFILYQMTASTAASVDTEKTTSCFFTLLRQMTCRVNDSLSTGTFSTSARRLVSKIAGYSMLLMESAPRRAFEVISTIDQLLPIVSSLNGVTGKADGAVSSGSASGLSCVSNAPRVVTATVESPHPYSPNSLHSAVCGFDKDIEIMFVELDGLCELASPDDTLCIYVGVDGECYVPVVRWCGGSELGGRQLMLPGNSLWFILESSAAVDSATQEEMYGFRCTVHGFGDLSGEPNMRLEQELAWLSASACRLLLQLPSAEDSLVSLCLAEEETRELLEKHGSLLRKGLSLSHIPTLHELHTRSPPSPALTPELKFCRDLQSGEGSSLAATLSRWLPLGRVVEPSRCQLLLPQQHFTVGSPVTMKLVTRDQCGRLVHCSNLSVEASVRRGRVCSEDENRQPVPVASEAFPLPPVSLFHQNPYVPVYLNKCRYMSVAMMPAYSKFCYEELRLALASDVAASEKISLDKRNGTTHSGVWFPRMAGTFTVECHVDGHRLPHSYTIDVLDSHSALHSSSSTRNRVSQLATARQCRVPLCASFSAIRLRSSPSLSSSPSGILPRGTVFSYMEEVENRDGKWIRLTDETTALYSQVNFPSQVWCLIYHRALDMVLIDMEEGGGGGDPSGSGGEPSRSAAAPPELPVAQLAENPNAEQSVLIETNELYSLAEGERVPLFSAPSLSSQLPDEYLLGARDISSDAWLHNSHGVWIRIAESHRFILAEDAIGRSSLSLHSRSASINGNNEEDEIQKPQRQLKPMRSEHNALRPSVAECCRAVFAAFVWHEHLVKDAMAAASYLKFRSHLQNMWSSLSEVWPLSMAPPPLQPLLRIWKLVCECVLTTLEQQPLLPSSRRSWKTAKHLGGGGSGSRPGSGNSGPLCELCEQRPLSQSRGTPPSIISHMRAAHPGCGGDSAGYGYNLAGKYTTGWVGHCGDGGSGSGSGWHLLCTTCRNNYLRLTPSGQLQERNRRWRALRLSSLNGESRPENVLKENALFLLDLNPSADAGESKNTSTNTSGWTINLFPTAAPASTVYTSIAKHFSEKLLLQPTSTSQQPASARRDSASTAAVHSSDPGPKGEPLHRSADDPMHAVPELLQSPSCALKSLVSLSSSTASSNVSVLLRRPVLAFVLEHHDLGRLREACAVAIRRSVAFSHAFRVWNWLLRLVSSESSVCDIILQYVWSLSSLSRLAGPSETGVEGTRWSVSSRLLPHPCRLCLLSGPTLSAALLHELHAFLYTVAVILQSSGIDRRLRSLCFRAWTIQLSSHEQDLLILTCNILATVGGVLSEPSSDGLCLVEWTESAGSAVPASSAVAEGTKKLLASPGAPSRAVDVKHMTDISASVRLDASSRQQLVPCLIDGNPDTFWESAEEAKAALGVYLEEASSPVLMALFIDNIRDHGHRFSSVTFRAAGSDGFRRKIAEFSVESHFCGWLKCCVAGLSGVQILMKGVAGSVRLRQLRVLGFESSGLRGSPTEAAQQQLLFSSPHRDAFALFQAIAAQAFSDELAEEAHGTLRQRVVELLFSRAHLQPLQAYVCSQIVNALQREVHLLSERTRRNYSYACGLMGMLVRVCGSRKGTELFSARDDLLFSLSQLVAFAPQIVECEALETLSRLLPLFSPRDVDCRQVLRNLLVAVAKCISLQVRDRSTRAVSAARFMTSCVDGSPEWRLDRQVSQEVGALCLQFLADATSDRFTPEWSSVFRRELGVAVLLMVELAGDLSAAASSGGDVLAIALRASSFWLAVAALAALRDKEWLKLDDSWKLVQETKPEEDAECVCENHDDGRTMAVVACKECEAALCRDCFRTLHLNRKNRGHQARLLGGASLAPQVDIHDGCSRLRLSSIVVNLHCSALQGMVSVLATDSFFPPSCSSSFGSSPQPLIVPSLSGPLSPSSRCRFCRSPLPPERRPHATCTSEECISLEALACCRVLSCGHNCGGVSGEKECLPCLRCPSDDTRQDGDDVCVVCLIDRLAASPCIRLESCGHIFHFVCLRTMLERRWSGPRILFRFMKCPLCSQQMSHPSLESLLQPLQALYSDVLTKALMRLEYDGLASSPAITDVSSEFYQKPEAYALDRYVYVLCSKCNKAYFGGESRCQQALEGGGAASHNPEDLICGGCSAVAGAAVCGRHGADFLEFKCRFCCSIAVYFCFGTTHFCAACHDDFQRLMSLPPSLLTPCPAGPGGVPLDPGSRCPLGLDHPPAGQEFAMGCGVCRNLHTF